MKIHRFFIEIGMKETEEDGAPIDKFILRKSVTACMEKLREDWKYPVYSISVMDEDDMKFSIEFG